MGLITSFFLPLYCGCEVVYLDPVEWSFRPDSLFRIIEKEQATLCWQPDFAFRHLCKFYTTKEDAIQYDLSSLRGLISCSEPCRKATFDEFWTVFRSFQLPESCLQTCYAMAETVFAISQSRFFSISELNVKEGFLSSGYPISGSEVKIACVGDGEYGEIMVKSEYLFGGYFLQQTDRISPEKWYRTGDLGLIEDGLLYVLGRIDDVLIIHGKKILAHQIEEFVGTRPGVKAGRVFCTMNSSESALTIYYEGDEIEVSIKSEIRRWISSSSGVSLDGLNRLDHGTLIKSSSGKIARKKTLAKLQAVKVLC